MKQLFYTPIDPVILKKEREKARQLRDTQWWKQKKAEGLCHHCQGRVHPSELTMDHIVPIGRGGKSTKGNIVPSCKECNSRKAHKTSAELILETISKS